MQAKPWLVLVLAGTLASAGAVSADAVSGDPVDSVGSEVRTVEVIAKRKLMSAPATPSVGAGFVAGGELVDGQGQTRVGEGYSHCGVVSVSVDVPPAVTTHCTSVFQLRGGELHLSGMRTYDSIALGFANTTVAIVGGTGEYANARGDGEVMRTSEHTAEVGYRFIFTLLE